MINSVQLKNFGPITELDWQNLGPINLVIGNNGCGKSFLLKAMYSAVRTLESYKRGKNPNSAAEILFEKLYWTFQPEKLGDLVTKSSDSALAFSLFFDQKQFAYSFGKDTNKTISTLENRVSPRGSDSIFLPAKEVLSLHQVILNSRYQDKAFGFDDTYVDLANALQKPLASKFAFDTRMLATEPPEGILIEAAGVNSKPFRQACQMLEEMIEGKIEYDNTENRWYFKKGKQKFNIGVTAEGIKKVAILDTLLNNGYLNGKSIVFVDEPESALHPKAISKLLDIISLLAKHGIQFFLASHSYFVIKKLFLIAQEQNLSIPVLSKEGDNWHQSDLLDGMPDNPIIDESIRLYEEEVDLAFK
jgi:AAA15 family ATPase/GTPase